jgi:hypothetical protein
VPPSASTRPRRRTPCRRNRHVADPATPPRTTGGGRSADRQAGGKPGRWARGRPGSLVPTGRPTRPRHGDRRRVRAVDRWWTMPRGRPRTRPCNRVACRPAVQAGRTDRCHAVDRARVLAPVWRADRRSKLAGLAGRRQAQWMAWARPGPPVSDRRADGAEKADGWARPTGRTPVRPTGSDRWADRAVTFDGCLLTDVHRSSPGVVGRRVGVAAAVLARPRVGPEICRA